MRLDHFKVGALLYTNIPALSSAGYLSTYSGYKRLIGMKLFDSSETNDSAIVNSVINVKNHKSRPHNDSLSWMKAMRLINSFTLLKVEGISYQIR